jgi:hypothetical protein
MGNCGRGLLVGGRREGALHEDVGGGFAGGEIGGGVGFFVEDVEAEALEDGDVAGFFDGVEGEGGEGEGAGVVGGEVDELAGDAAAAVVGVDGEGAEV